MKKAILKIVETILKVKIIPNWRLEKVDQIQKLQKIIEYHNIGTIFDVGANEGQFGEFLRNDVGFEGTILSFEPALEPFEVLKQKTEIDPEWNCFLIGLGSEEKTEKFNIMAGSRNSSFLNPLDKQSLQENNTIDSIRKNNIVVDTYDIEIKTLNNMWAVLSKDYELSSVFLKMDTQGYDLNVIQGGEEILHNVKVLQTELSIIPLYENMPYYADVLDYLRTLHFEIYSMHTVLLDKKMRLVEFDGVFVNTNFSLN